MCNTTTTTMVTAVRTTINPKTPSHGGGGGGARTRTRTPLLPSDPDNSLAPRRVKSRDVTSRYLSSSSSLSSVSASSNPRRSASPHVSRTLAAKVTPAPATALKRSQSAERRRPVTPRLNASDSRNWSAADAGGGGEVPAAQRMLFTSTRSLSVSFQGGSFSMQVSKAKPSPSPSVRKSTPERRKVVATTPVSENSKPIEHPQRWPGCRSLSFGDERRGGTGSGGNVVRALENSMADYGRRLMTFADVSSSAIGSESASEDSESVSSGSIYSGTIGQGQRGPRGFVVPARFLQETKNRLHRPPEPGSPVYRNQGGARTLATASKLVVPPRKLSMDSPVSSPRGVVNSRGQSSPIRGTFRPASPNKAAISATSTPLSRGISPSRARSLVPATPSSNYSNNMSSILSFAVDVRRGKVGENRIHDAHVLRLLYNRLLQWRFVNARADASLSAQRLNAERSIYNAWVTTENLRESVRAKRTELQFMRQTMKLICILKGQMTYLEEWSSVDESYTGSLSGAIEALKASTLRLPVIGGARAEIQNVKDAICSAIDVLQAMVSSIGLLSPKVEEVNSSVGELSKLTAKERALLGQCKILLSTVAALQVKERSLRTHIVQQKRVQT